jgi:hypothetical protein
MLYNTQNRWVRDSIELEKTTFWKLNLFPSSGKVSEAHNLLGLSLVQRLR